MKQISLLSAILITCISINAQIVLQSSDLATVGWANRIARDTVVSGINWGNPGANQTYTFTNLQNMQEDTTIYKALTASQQSNFPSADVAITNDNINFLFSKTSSSDFSIHGVEGLLLGSSDFLLFSPTSKVYQFPIQYQSNFSGNSGFVKEKLGSDFTPPLEFNGLPIYQVKITNTTNYKDTIDGWGKVTTPVGTYNCLRQKRVETSNTVVDVKLSAITPYTNVSNTRDTTIRYNYLTKETKGPVLGFTYDTLNNPTQVTWSLIAPTATTGIENANLLSASIYPNPASDMLNVFMGEPLEAEGVKIEIYDMLGQLTVNNFFTPGAQLFVADISTLQAGIYTVIYSDKSIKKTIGKFSKY
jgi:hypothetical protein